MVRDVGRVLDLPYMFCDGLSKLIPAAPGKQYSLDDAVEMVPELAERVKNEEEVAELWILAKKAGRPDPQYRHARGWRIDCTGPDH